MPITVVLLAAGYATRLYPLTQDRPKALLPLGRSVILDEVVRGVRGVPDVRAAVLVTNHRFADQFRDWQRRTAAPVQIVDDGTGTAQTRLGAIRDLELARRAGSPHDDVLVIGTDNLFAWSLADFVAQARRVAPQPSIALWQAPSKAAATQFGVVLREASGRITSFVEKSPQPPSAEVALCVYYFPAAVCGQIREFLDSGGNADAPGYFIQWLVGRGTVYGVMMPGAWYDIGSLESYDTVKREWPHVR
ncbi:MAG: nucleotidyltransferase family protein [Candidatus Omnitrophica bacterium]|nr:nucleotidyltransferase family protein [Candidatus Omnitrophota bacterium]